MNNQESNIYFTDQGQGDPIILIHGTGFNSHCWSKVIEPLAKEFRVIGYDRRGYGKSTGEIPGKEMYNQTQADDLLNLINQLNLQNITLVAWSAGGIHAYHTLLKDSSQIKQLIAYEPSLHISKQRDLALLKMVISLRLKKAFCSNEKAMGVFAEWVGSQKNGHSGIDQFRTDVENIYLKDAAVALSEFEAGTGEELTPEQLKRIKVPITFLIGELTSKPFEVAMKHQIDIFKAPLVTLKNSGHFAHIENPGEFVKAIRQIKNGL